MSITGITFDLIWRTRGECANCRLRSGEVDPIVLAFADASMRAVENARILVAEIDEIRSGWEETLTLRKNSRAWDVLDVIVRRPVLDAATAAREIGVEAPNAYPALNALTDAGVLTVTNEYRLGRIWRSDAILDAIDAFAERAGRRE